MIGAFLVGAVGNAIPYLVLNLRNPGDDELMGLAYGGVVVIGTVVAPILGMVAWRFDRSLRGLLAMWVGFAVGGIVGAAPFLLDAGDSPAVVAITVGPAVVQSTVGWCAIGMFASLRSRRWTARSHVHDK